MPDQRLPSRRSTDSRPPSRALAHLAVIGLVVLSAALGLRAIGGADAAFDRGFPFNLIGVARGADGDAFVARSVSFDLVPDPVVDEPELSRRSTRYEPDPTPLPTPVAPPPPPVYKAAAAPAPAPIVGNGMLLWPVPGGKITQYYSSYHLALDIAKSSGTPVMAAADGTVTWSGWRNNGGGYVIQIDHGNGVQTVYNHLGSMSVQAEAVVTAGQTIAAVGCSGTCTGPHVHFAVIVNGVFINPLRYL